MKIVKTIVQHEIIFDNINPINGYTIEEIKRFLSDGSAYIDETEFEIYLYDFEHFTSTLIATCEYEDEDFLDIYYEFIEDENDYK